MSTTRVHHPVQGNLIALIAERAGERTPLEIATAITDMERSGDVSEGTRLPTVRELAQRLHVSASTVSQAWDLLIRNGVVRTAGRRGTFVTGLAPVPLTPRGTWSTVRRRLDLDLSTGTPDTALLPPLSKALSEIAVTVQVDNYNNTLVLPELEDAIRDSWRPTFTPESVLMVDGALDGVDRVLREGIRLGDRVLVEEIGLPAIFDLVQLHGGIAVPVRIDEHGLVPSSVREGLRANPSAIVLQPRAHNPTGVSMTPQRAAQLAAVLDGTDVLVVEDDSHGDIAYAPLATLAAHRPRQTVHIKSFSKSHGPDLRMAVVAGPRTLLSRVELRRRLGPGWSSMLGQRVLAHMLTDPETRQLVADARETYVTRRIALRDELVRAGLTTTGWDSVNIWVGVGDARRVAQALGDAGLGIAPGDGFQYDRAPCRFIRITCAALKDRYAEIADAVAAFSTVGA